MSKFNPLEVKGLVAEHLTNDGDVVSIDRDKAVKAVLDHIGVDEADIKKAQEATSSVAATVAAAFSDVAIENMATNKTLEQQTLKFKVGHEEVNIAIGREAEFRNPTTGDTFTKKGTVKVSRTIKHGDSLFKSIKEYANEIGVAKL